MRNEWKAFWASTFMYLTPRGMLMATTRFLPRWLDKVMEAVIEGTALAVKLLLLIALLPWTVFPCALVAMLYLTPKRIRVTRYLIQQNNQRFPWMEKNPGLWPKLNGEFVDPRDRHIHFENGEPGWHSESWPDGKKNFLDRDKDGNLVLENFQLVDQKV